MSTNSAIDTNFWNSIQNTALTLPARVVLAAIRFRSHASGYCWPRQSVLAGWCGLSLGQVKRAIKELREAGLIMVKSRGFLRGLEYYPVLEPQNSPCGAQDSDIAGQSPIQEAIEAPYRRPDPHVGQDARQEVTSDPMRSTSELETAVQGSPVTYIKENVLIRKKQTGTKTIPADPPVTSSVSISNFEELKIWSGHTCLRCGTKDQPLNPVMVEYARGREDIGNLMPLCDKCASKVTGDYQGIDRPDFRVKFAQAHGLPWPSCFGPDPADKAAEEAESLISQLPAKARTWVLSKKDQLPLILPVVKSLLKKLHLVTNPVGYLINGWRNQLKEATA
ncbi:MAG: helix-turn-helix domain-containing protein [Deltaproteobacteria bacterium]|nr:helix-turn-helix domain-containing protein [Deltaproteobacteria bacterium]